MNLTLLKNFVQALFFGNFFYGICVIALAVESSLQQRVALNSFSVYALMFVTSLVYYNLAFSEIDENSREGNIRQDWYHKHRVLLKRIQVVYLALLLILLYMVFYPILPVFSVISMKEVVLFCLFPLFALLYYGIHGKGFKTANLRNIGWLKPFIIGFTWAGAVGILPQMLAAYTNARPYEISTVAMLLFLKNFMFVSVLSIMFDIKDYARDYNFQLKTFVVKFGLRKTIFLILLPLLLLGWISFVVYGISRDFSFMKIFLNTLPFLLCMFVALELQRRKSIYFYLVVIDGLMLVKALCGSVAMHYF